MSASKTRNKFSLYTPPQFYKQAPRKPEKVIKTESTEDLWAIEAHQQYALSDLIEYLPEGKTLEDVVVYAETNTDVDGEPLCEVTFKLLHRHETPNLRYDEDVKLYQQEYADYRAAKSEHKKLLKEWEEWAAKEKSFQLEAQLKRAEKLLKDHNRL